MAADNYDDVLSDEELEALAEGVESGEVPVEGDRGARQEGVVLYNFHQPAHLLKARLPAVDLVNERFAKDYQTSLFGFIRRLIEYGVEELQLIKLSEYINSLPEAASVNRVKINELNGSMLINIDAALVYVIVDCYFGGPGNVINSNEAREYTAMEKRIIERVVNLALGDLKASWEPITTLHFDFMHSENREQLLAASDGSEIVVLSRFKIKLGDVEGDIDMVMPHGLLEPLRPVLASGVRKEHADSDDSWKAALRNRLADVELDINAVFTETDISLGELLSLKPGDFIPVEMTEITSVFSEGIKLFEGKIGMSNQAAAVRLLHWNTY